MSIYLIYISIYLYIHTHTYTYTYTYTYTCTCTYTHTYTYTYTYTHTYTYTYTYTHTYTHTYTYVVICVYIYIYICIYVLQARRWQRAAGDALHVAEGLRGDGPAELAAVPQAPGHLPGILHCIIVFMIYPLMLYHTIPHRIISYHIIS